LYPYDFTDDVPVEDDGSAVMESTPVAQPAALPDVDDTQKGDIDEAQTPESSIPQEEENVISLPDENEIEDMPSPPSSPPPRSPSPVTEEAAASTLPSPPPESPTHTREESLLSLATPPRKSASNISKVEFFSPSPPRGGLPELPALPSFSEEEEMEQEEEHVTPQRIDESALPIKTPKPPGSWDVSVRQPMKELDDNSPENYRANFTAMNTPKPPGAWAATPAPAPKQPLLTHSHTDDSRVDDTENTGLLTPLPTLTRASTMPAITPGTARRKSILKVRFDVNQVADTSSEADAPPRPAEPQPRDEVVQKELDFWTDALHAQKDLGGDERPLPARPQTPEPATAPRTQRRPQTPGIRMLDSFGREQKEDGEKIPKASVSQPVQQTPRNRSGVRLVDAMGHAVQEESSFSSTIKSEDETTTTTETETDTPMSHSEALDKLRRRLASLSEGLRDADRSVNELDADDHRTAELQEMSKRAREERARIARRLEDINLRDLNFGALSSENNPLKVCCYYGC
jgi:serine/arginine repetitive matrix protein 2